LPKASSGRLAKGHERGSFASWPSGLRTTYDGSVLLTNCRSPPNVPTGPCGAGCRSGSCASVSTCMCEPGTDGTPVGGSCSRSHDPSAQPGARPSLPLTDRPVARHQKVEQGIRFSARSGRAPRAMLALSPRCASHAATFSKSVVCRALGRAHSTCSVRTRQQDRQSMRWMSASSQTWQAPKSKCPPLSARRVVTGHHRCPTRAHEAPTAPTET